MRALLWFLQRVAPVPAGRYPHSKAFSAGAPAGIKSRPNRKEDAKNAKGKRAGRKEGRKGKPQKHGRWFGQAEAVKSHILTGNPYAIRNLHPHGLGV